MQGLPNTREWLEGEELEIKSNATCILVIEKEGVYNRLSEDRFFERIPSILVTGKGYPDLATRALVKTLHTKLQIPVYGICDCNPFGLGVLHTYQVGSKRIGIDGNDRYGVPIQWMGLRPSHVKKLRERKELPKDVYQSLTDLDLRRLENLCDETHSFHQGNDAKLGELLMMRESGYKIELEALHWIGMDYMSNWLERVLKSHKGGDENAIL
jgi:meiotic recombination protein SPO11